ncbi:MAG: arginine--tRNA ligase [Candidatus Marsarchaeota archaeon]|nr:arginine--tRNA ligase [Candidatus Marsarchaeota archaeon]
MGESARVGDPMLAVKAMVENTLRPVLGAAEIRFEVPPDPEMGDLAVPLHAAAKAAGASPQELAVKSSLSLEKDATLVESAKPVNGYVNVFLKTKAVADLLWEMTRTKQLTYGFSEKGTERFIVEHTSANPIHPLTVGHARNAIYGDTIARILRATGRQVETHFYIDDTGRQTAVAALGYKMVGDGEPRVKPDVWAGELYALTSALVEIDAAKRALSLKDEAKVEEAKAKIDEWVGVVAELAEKSPQLYELLSEKAKDIDLQREVASIIAGYERGEREVSRVVRQLVKLVLEGHRQTLSRSNINHDVFDYESDLLWEGDVDAVLSDVRSSKYAVGTGLSISFKCDNAAEDLGLKKLLNISPNYTIPDLVLTRSDGTTLYTTRDIAYSLRKLARASRVLNVVGVEQSLKQLQLKVVLYALGHPEALNQSHVAYEFVDVAGFQMSSRRGRLISFDSMLDQARDKAIPEVKKRNPSLSDEQVSRVAEAIGVAAIRFALAGIGANKRINFTWDRVLDFERNSGPYVLYTYARIRSILGKAQGHLVQDDKPDFELLTEKLEHRLIVLCSRLPETMRFAAETLRTEVVTEYVLRVCDIFNSYYAAVPVLKAETAELSSARLALVTIVEVCLGSVLGVLGITPLERM